MEDGTKVRNLHIYGELERTAFYVKDSTLNKIIFNATVDTLYSYYFSNNYYFNSSFLPLRKRARREVIKADTRDWHSSLNVKIYSKRFTGSPSTVN